MTSSTTRWSIRAAWWVAGYNDLPDAASVAVAQRGTRFATARYQQQPVRIATIARHMPEERVPGWALVTVAQTTHAREQLTNDMSIKVWTLIVLMTRSRSAPARWRSDAGSRRWLRSSRSSRRAIRPTCGRW